MRRTVWETRRGMGRVRAPLRAGFLSRVLTGFSGAEYVQWSCESRPGAVARASSASHVHTWTGRGRGPRVGGPLPQRGCRARVEPIPSVSSCVCVPDSSSRGLMISGGVVRSWDELAPSAGREPRGRERSEVESETSWVGGWKRKPRRSRSRKRRLLRAPSRLPTKAVVQRESRDAPGLGL